MSIGDAIYAVNEIIARLEAGIPGAVKQIASGVFTSTSNTDLSDVTITTGITVDPGKTVVLLNSGTTSTMTAELDATLAPSVLVSKTATTITISPPLLRRSGGTILRGRTSWQVIEFY